MSFYSGGKKSDDKDKLAKHNAILAAHGHEGYGPSGGASPASKKKSGGGGKGGSNPDLDPREDRELLRRRIRETTTDNKWGYYAPSGEYVSGFRDRFDGGGKNTTGTYFVGGGPLSTLANVAKIRPAGMASERDAQGNYIVPRENIGFRNVAHMTDRGGPQAAGGAYQGGPYGISNIFNALDYLGGVDQGERVAYDNPAMEAYNRRVAGLMEVPQNSAAYIAAKQAEERERQRRMYSPRPMLRPPSIMGP